MDVAEIKKGFHELSVEDRLRLLHDLWDELATEPSALDLSADEQAELQRRFDEHAADGETSTAWDQVRNAIRGRH